MTKLPPGVEALDDFSALALYERGNTSHAEDIQEAFAAGARAGFLAGLEAGWIDASEELPERRTPGDPNSVVVLAIAETGDGCLQMTPALVRGGKLREWREVRFDHDGQGRKLVVRCWRPMPKFPKRVPAIRALGETK